MRNLDFLFLRRRQGKSEGFGQCPNVGLSGPVCVCSGGEGGERTGAGIQGEELCTRAADVPPVVNYISYHERLVSN